MPNHKIEIDHPTWLLLKQLAREEEDRRGGTRVHPAEILREIVTGRRPPLGKERELS